MMAAVWMGTDTACGTGIGLWDLGTDAHLGGPQSMEMVSL